MPINPIHLAGSPENLAVQSFDMRMYFPAEMRREDVIDRVMTVLQDSMAMSNLISAYELVNDGFGHLVPDDANGTLT
jgi:hypothetical protein